MTTTHPSANDSGLNLDHLEALARAATPGEWKAMPFGRVVGGPPRHYINGSAPAQIASFNVTYHEQAPEDEPERQQANADFAAAANPAAVLALIALARRAALTNQPAPTVPVGDAFRAAVRSLMEKWHNDAVEAGFGTSEAAVELDELLDAHQPAQEQAFPERDQTKPAEQQGLFHKFDVRRTDGSDQPGGKHHGCRYYVLDLDHDQHAPAAMRAYAAAARSTHPQLAADVEAEFGTAQQEPVAAPQQAAAPGALDAEEMTRLRRLMHALGHADAFEQTNDYVRGVLFAVLGQAAGKLERAAQLDGGQEGSDHAHI